MSFKGCVLPDQNLFVSTVDEARPERAPDNEQFQRCLVMAGGGFRFGYYLGMYRACQLQGKAPDVIVASCGAAIAGALIRHLPDDEQRLAWISSPQMHSFWRGLQANPDISLWRAIRALAQRALFANDARRIPDLFQDYLFDIPPDLPLPPEMSYPAAPALAIVAGRLLYGQDEVGTLRGGKKLFAETIFTEPRVAGLLAGMPSPIASNAHKNSVVAPQIEFETQIAVADAVRASIADMYYFRCHQIGEHYYSGGVIDLFPIEIARRLAKEVMMERKGWYGRHIELPALRMVLGINGNHRLRHVLQQEADVWIDTADMETALVQHQISKQIQWLRNRIVLRVPERYDGFVSMVRLQWEYGYQRASQALAQAAGNR
ncbi:patatin-like phospholipase family protein [Undibacterium aquatile]|uniref:Patatin-like phospholipase family protein n=1 Tax=Undibacterium aquatile TaxID=1537398 RepID=A0ABR6XCR9_9BURK|nr:patatin-like phospholipase family protein [Undibacterium aquatile]MBC3810712.1 patatin-like phospholipase family protein [Undibacterium aquatile]